MIVYKIYTFEKNIVLFVILLYLFINPIHVFASPDIPLEIKIMHSKVTQLTDDQDTVIITLVNSSPYELKSIDVVSYSNLFIIDNIKEYPLVLNSFSSAAVIYAIKPRSKGNEKIVFSISYYWEDNMGNTHNRIDTISTDEIYIEPKLDFDWPAYLIPLTIGFLFGQVGTFIAAWIKDKKDIKSRIEQANGILLAGIQTAKKCIELKEEIAFSFWEDLIIKQNLYPSLLRLGKNLKQTSIAKRFADISIRMKDYNSLRKNGKLNEDFIIDLEDELASLINILENN